jgi:signal transduction histidine kinase
MYFGMDKNNLILPEYTSPLQQFSDHASSYAIMGIYVFVLVGMVLDFYKKQNLDLAITQVQLNEQVELVQKENQRKENLLGILAHDVKNPISNLRQLCELYQDGMVSEQKLKELMKAMQVRIEDLQGTIDGILGQLNTEIKQEIANEGMGSPVVTTEKVLRLLQYKLDSKNQKVQFLHPEASDISGTIEKKSNEISIILKNLIDNAYKYSPNGSLVTIRLMEVEKQLIWEVEDEGCGITADKQKQLFKNTLSSDEGSGMGLYLCQSIAESIGALISYQPKSKGSMFRLSVNV